MKQALRLTIVGITAALGTAVMIPAIAQSNNRLSNDSLIVPGQSIGRTPLSSHGNYYLNQLPKADATSAGMSQMDLVWATEKGNPQTDTLYIHTISNAALDVQPSQDVTINNIRVTSSWFHTQAGISTGSTLAQVRDRFPNVQPVDDSDRTLYEDADRGITFEFAQDATPKSPCIAISVYMPGSEHVVNAANVTALLTQGL